MKGDTKLSEEVPSAIDDTIDSDCISGITPQAASENADEVSGAHR
jgi:hypothetical protein